MPIKFFSTALYAGLANAVLAAGLLCWSVASGATVFNYTFNGLTCADGTCPGSFASNTGGPAMSVTAWGDDTLVGDNWTQRQVSRRTNALGVDSDPGDGTDFQIGPRLEGLQFDLGSVFGWASITIDFSLFSQVNDSVDIWASDTAIMTAGVIDSGASQLGNNSTSNPFVAHYPLNFRYLFISNNSTQGGSAACGAPSNCFLVDNLRIVVPEPASMGLLAAAGVLLIGFSRRARG